MTTPKSKTEKLTWRNSEIRILAFQLVLISAFVFTAFTAQAQKLGALVTTNAVAATDTIPVTTDSGANTFKVSVSNLFLVYGVVSPDGSATNLAVIGNLFANSGTFSNGITLAGTGRGFVTLWDSNGTHNITLIPAAAMTTNIFLTFPTNPAPGFMYGTLSGGTNLTLGATPFLVSDASGNLTSLGQFQSGNNIWASSSGTIGWTSGSRIKSAGSGITAAVQFYDSGNAFAATLQGNVPYLEKTTNFTNLSINSGFMFNNRFAIVPTTNTLPASIPSTHFWFVVSSNQLLSIKALSQDSIRWGSTTSPLGGDIWSSQMGSAIHVVCTQTNMWVVNNSEGAWTLVAPRTGNATLIGGTLTVANATVTANTAVIFSRKTAGGTIGDLTYTTIAGTSFTLTSSSGTDTSTVSWNLVEIPN